MNLQPLPGYVFVRRLDSVKEKNGILMPTIKEEEEIVEGIVSMTNPADADYGPVLADIVLYAPFELKKLEFDSVTYQILPISDILATTGRNGAPEYQRPNLSQRIIEVAGRNVLVEWEETTQTFPGGQIIKPTQYSRRQYTGVVLGVGPDVLTGEGSFQVGDRVMFEQFSDFKYWYEPGKRFAIIRAKFILAVLPSRETAVEEEAYV